jgi:hypothetical protein
MFLLAPFSFACNSRFSTAAELAPGSKSGPSSGVMVRDSGHAPSAVPVAAPPADATPAATTLSATTQLAQPVATVQFLGGGSSAMFLELGQAAQSSAITATPCVWNA